MRKWIPRFKGNFLYWPDATAPLLGRLRYHTFVRIQHRLTTNLVGYLVTNKVISKPLVTYTNLG